MSLDECVLVFERIAVSAKCPESLGITSQKTWIISHAAVRTSDLMANGVLDTPNNRGTWIFKECVSHVQIINARRVQWSKFHTEDTQFWCDLWNPHLSVLSACCIWNDSTVLCKRGQKTIIIMPTVRYQCTNFNHLGCVHPCQMCEVHSVLFLLLCVAAAMLQ
jgi:hypothetical protein